MTIITSEVVRELLHYDPSTGVFTWRPRGRSWFKRDRDCNAWNAKHAGKRAGNVQVCKPGGYRRRHIAICNVSRLEHHIAWLYMTDEPVPPQIDHLDRDATNNAWENLRASSAIANAYNRSMLVNNTSGVNGVYWHKRARKWAAHCQIGGKKYYLGLFTDVDEAAKAAMEFRAVGGFDPGHGIEVAHYHNSASAC